MENKQARMRRAAKSRAKIRRLGVPSLSVHRTDKNTYAQIIETREGKVLASANTLQKDVRGDLSSGTNKEAATAVGKALGERAREKGIEKVAFDRSGYKYHGVVKALADAAREAGLQF